MLTEGKALYELSLKSRNGVVSLIHVTDNHPFWVNGKGWIESAKLKPGMKLEDFNKSLVSVVRVTPLKRIERTYNFTVDDYHTYFAGEARALVHNECACAVVAKDAGKAAYVVTPSGVAIPTKAAELKSNLSVLTEASTNPASSRKFVGTDSQGPLRVRIEKGHAADPNFTGKPDPLHTVDHLHLDRRANGTSGPWSSTEKTSYGWPF